MLGGLADPVIVVDDRMVITSANAAAGRLFGLAPEHLVGRLSTDWVHEPDRVEAAERLGALLDGQTVRAATLRLVREGDGLRWVEVTGARFADAKGNVRAAISVRDIAGRIERELAGTRAVSRSHLLSQLAVEFQSVTPGGFTEVVHAALARLGDAALAAVVELHEIEPDGTTLLLRGRWAGRGTTAERAIAAARTNFADVPALRAALSGRSDLVEVRPTDQVIDEAKSLDPSLEVALAVPLRPGDQLLGLLTIGWPTAHELTNDDRDLAVSAGRVVGTALERVRAQQALLESEALFRDLFHGSSAVMYLIDPATLRLVDANQAAADFYGYSRTAMLGMDLHRLTVHSKERLAERVESLRQDGATSVIEEHQQLADGTVRHVEIHSTPMRIASREFDLAIVQDVTDQRLAHANLQRLASTDELTGALNRRRFFELVTAELAEARVTDPPGALLMLDLDHFKAINDERGHIAGDTALVAFADACRTVLRSDDRFARLGGEEFAVFLPRTGLDQALRVAESIRAAAEGSDATVSIGVAEQEPGGSLDALYARADRRLYEAKQAGRNRVVG
ncbi:sensor domain-containing diguanylate cyclase [Actinomarinicola tropica]|uniref:Diguanylate cyclase n=1 Tax=Actinomarinicola tropica TaxID=2789776 RepID=A0A5Q2RMH9_9ACTN|nr:diguanylate cyclase [Actinomarinicola tropica]QGG96674.1 diguanylate cyclase [Actinomarinicola tropica]